MKNTIFAVIFALSSNVVAEELLKSEKVTISDSELAHYLEDRLPPEAKNQSLTSKKTYIESLENIYLIKHFAALATEGEGLSDQELWVAELERERVLMKFYISKYIEAKFENIDWDAIVTEEYVANKEAYKTKERVAASHILIKTSGRGDKEALALAIEIHQKLVAGEDFSELAKQYSEDKGSKKGGGSLGYFEHKSMVKPFADAAFALNEVGQISEPVKSIFGFHIVKLDGRKSAGYRSMDEIRGKVIAKRKEQLRQKLHKDLVFAAKTSDSFSINQDNVQKLKQSMEAKYPLPKIGR